MGGLLTINPPLPPPGRVTEKFITPIYIEHEETNKNSNFPFSGKKYRHDQFSQRRIDSSPPGRGLRGG